MADIGNSVRAPHESYYSASLALAGLVRLLDWLSQLIGAGMTLLGRLKDYTVYCDVVPRGYVVIRRAGSGDEAWKRVL